jgi:hypothetical protein
MYKPLPPARGTSRIISRNVTRFVSSGCGTGKTYAACQFVKRHTHRKILWVSPTKELLRNTAIELEELDLKPTVITSDEYPKTAVGEIVNRLKSSRPADLVLITWNAYERLPFFPDKQDWIIIIDEVPQLDKLYELTLPKNHWLLTDYVAVEEGPHPDLGHLVLIDEAKAYELLEGVWDDAEDKVRNVVNAILRGNRDVYVDMDSWNRICEAGAIGETDEENTIYILSLLNWKLFQGAVLLGANIEKSILKKHLETKHGARFEPCHEIIKGLRPAPVYGDRVEIGYFLEHTRTSKQFMKRMQNGVSNVDQMDMCVRDYFAERDFLYVCNNDRRKSKSRIIDDLPNKIDVSVLCHGSNEYQACDNIYLNPALNRNPKHFKMMELAGLSVEEIQIATAYETYYQGAFRTSLRDPSSVRPVKIIVPDRFIAIHLADQLGTANVKKLGAIAEKPSQKPYSPNEKRRRYERSKRWEELFPPKTIPKTFRYTFGIDFGKTCKAKNTNSSTIFMTLHKSKYDHLPEEFHEVEDQVQTIIQFMRSEAGTIVEEKDERYMFNAGSYQPPEGSEGYRRQEYFREGSCLILDFDSGRVSPQDFINIFGKDALKERRRSFLIFNSFSRAPDDPNRFRVVMFYQRPVTSIVEHRSVFDWIEEVLDNAGYPSEVSGLDQGCRSGNQSFYMPCTNRKYPDQAFFEAHWTKSCELAKYAIDPDDCVAFYPPMPVTHVRQPLAMTSSQPSCVEIERILGEVRDAPDGRNNLGFVAICRLSRMGLDHGRIEMEYTARFNRDKKMMNRLKGYMKSLPKYEQNW